MSVEAGAKILKCACVSATVEEEDKAHLILSAISQFVFRREMGLEFYFCLFHPTVVFRIGEAKGRKEPVSRQKSPAAKEERTQKKEGRTNEEAKERTNERVGGVRTSKAENWISGRKEEGRKEGRNPPSCCCYDCSFLFLLPRVLPFGR